MSLPDRCPKCGASMEGDPIPEGHRRHKPDHDEQVARYDRCYCLPWGDRTHFSRLIGVQINGIYDGALYWACPDCSHAWPRWTDGASRLIAVSAEYADRHNARTAS